MVTIHSSEDDGIEDQRVEVSRVRQREIDGCVSQLWIH